MRRYSKKLQPQSRPCGHRRTELQTEPAPRSSGAGRSRLRRTCGLSLPLGRSVEDDLFVFGIGDLPPGLEPPDGLAHVLGLQRGQLPPLLAHVQR